jgi:hypothetical protein
MLDCRAIGRLPECLSFTRGGLEVTAARNDLGTIHVRNRRLWVADPMLLDAAAPLPLRPSDGAASVHTYVWDHPCGPINVCAVVRFRPQGWANTRRLAVRTDVRPDLAEGVIVDCGEIAIRSADAVQLRSGLGDGYYPVYANYNLGAFAQSVIVDFEVWRVRDVILLPGQQLDEFGILRRGPFTGQSE